MFEYGIRYCYSDKLEGTHGLGQCVKMIIYNDPNTF